VLFVAVSRTSATFRKLSAHSKKDQQRLAALFRRYVEELRAADTQSARLLVQSHQLEKMQQLPDGDFRPIPIGVVIGNTKFARTAMGPRFPDMPEPLFPELPFLGTQAAATSDLGFFRILVPKGVDPSDLIKRWRNGEPHYKPQAEWITPSPFGDAALQESSARLVVLHHGKDGFAVPITEEARPAVSGSTLPDDAYQKKFVGAAELARILEKDPHLQAALAAADPERPIFLMACDVSGDEARVIADTLGRKIHFLTDVAIMLPREQLNSSTLPFSVTDGERRKFDASLDTAPPKFRDVGKMYGFSVLAVFADADSPVLPIQTVTPSTAYGESSWLVPIQEVSPK
jgi:hypothetical protein